MIPRKYLPDKHVLKRIDLNYSTSLFKIPRYKRASVAFFYEIPVGSLTKLALHCWNQNRVGTMRRNGQCRICYHKLNRGDKFCAGCGRKIYTKRVSDSDFWRTYGYKPRPEEDALIAANKRLPKH